MGPNQPRHPTQLPHPEAADRASSGGLPTQLNSEPSTAVSELSALVQGAGGFVARRAAVPMW